MVTQPYSSLVLSVHVCLDSIQSGLALRGVSGTDKAPTTICPWTLCRVSQDTDLFVHVCVTYWPIFKSFHCYIHREIAIKRLMQISPHLKRVATLPCEILVFKKLQRQTKTARNEENVNELVLSRWDQPQIYRLIHQTAPSGVVRILFFSTAILVWRSGLWHLWKSHRLGEF